MVPEGLQFRSVAQIVTTIKSLGMNVVRLTYATEMVDQVLAGRTDAKAGFIKALGARNGQAVWSNITQRNGWRDGITRLQVFIQTEFLASFNLHIFQIFDAVAAECARQGIMVHLDNHISKAMWCCNTRDGNSWFGDKSFNTDRWIRGWSFMANHVRLHFDGVSVLTPSSRNPGPRCPASAYATSCARPTMMPRSRSHTTGTPGLGI
jgi:hypothetical protein